ncbi:MAG TPA: pyridoxal-phosphate dependent enzyme [Opitutaceae bacterium]|nr:pyridoxal-phosphate dependent enzyme [Opitutaceae bacterium]
MKTSASPIKVVNYGGWNIGLKIEGPSPDQSHKSRAAAHVVARLRWNGLIRGTVASKVQLVVSSSGNAANEIAKLTAGTNAKIRVFTDVLSATELIERLKAWPHVAVSVINEPDRSGSHAAARKRALDTYRKENPGSVEIDQYHDSDWACGYFSLFREIEWQVPNVSAIFVPVGTAATAMSAVRFKILYQRRWKIFAVDAMGSALHGAPIGTRRFSGYGNGAQTEWARQTHPHVDGWLRVPDEAVVQAARWLRARGHYLGASSAAVFAATVHRIASDTLPHGGVPVLICSDHGRNYESTLYSDNYLLRNGLGHVAEAVAT